MLADIWAEIAKGLPGYPLPVRILGWAWLFATLALLVLVPFLKPEKVPPAFRLDTINVKSNDAGLLALELALRNPTAAPVTVTEIKLEFVPGERPTAGLQSGVRETVQYELFEIDGDWMARDENALSSQVTVRKPFDGIDYAVATLDASEGIEAGKLHRLIVLMPRGALYGPEADTVIASVKYAAGAEDKTTNEAQDALR